MGANNEENISTKQDSVKLKRVIGVKWKGMNRICGHGSKRKCSNYPKNREPRENTVVG